MSEAMARDPIPAGQVSTIRGRWQVPGLTVTMRVVAVLGLAGALLPDDVGTPLAVAAVGAVVAVPLLRVAWLIFRWVQEQDWRFVALGVALLTVVGGGALLAALGVGS